jgi:hypothetical protein
MQFPKETLFCVVDHAGKKVVVFKRKLDAIYSHVSFKKSAGYYEHHNLKSVYRKHKGYAVSFEVA